MRAATAAGLCRAGLDPAAVIALARAALEEDLGADGDITSAATIPAGTTMTARYVTRAPGIAAGLPVLAAMVEALLGEDATCTLLVSDGDRLATGQALAAVRAPARDLLALERTSLNLLSHLCGIATLTRAWSDAVAGTPARIRDTRKTTPGLRFLEKYAVRCGGGVNHRAGLYDAILIKDNHVAAAGGVGRAVEAARAAARAAPGDAGGRTEVVIQVEVDTLEQLAEALDHGAPQVLLDNLDVATTRRAVELVRRRSPGTLVEASGGLRLADAAAVAATGVDFLAVGALTHSAPALDIGLDIELDTQPDAEPHLEPASQRHPADAAD